MQTRGFPSDKLIEKDSSVFETQEFRIHFEKDKIILELWNSAPFV